MLNRTVSRVNWLLITFILIGAFLRFVDLAPLSDTLFQDEAFNGNDAVSLLAQPRLTPFFDGNNGRKSGWMYEIAAFIAVFGAQPVALRLAAVMTGVLTLAALYPLACELMNERAATWSVGALAVLFWHMHLSRIALRAILMPLVGALAFAFLLRAYRRGQRRDWIVGGVLVGLLAYTYLAARLWIGYTLILLAILVVFDPARRKHSLLAAGLAALPGVVRARWQPAWLLGLALTALAPSIMTNDAPHPLRAIGLVLPLALTAGAGAWWIEQRVARWRPGRWAALPLLDSGMTFRSAYLAPRPVALFNPAECWVASAVPAVYVTTDAESAGYREALARWSEPALLRSGMPKTHLLTTTLSIWQAAPRAAFLAEDPAVTFVAGDRLQFRRLSDWPAVVASGDTLPLTWRIAPLRDLNRPYSVFIHLYRMPIDFAAGPISQGDAPLCISYPTDLWRLHERVLQDFSLPVPANVEPGAYAVIAGVYDTETGARLPVTFDGTTGEYIVLGQVDLK